MRRREFPFFSSLLPSLFSGPAKIFLRDVRVANDELDLFRSRKGQPGVTACWYYRPEQTFHAAHRQFWENEVFKTSKYLIMIRLFSVC